MEIEKLEIAAFKVIDTSIRMTNKIGQAANETDAEVVYVAVK